MPFSVSSLRRGTLSVLYALHILASTSNGVAISLPAPAPRVVEDKSLGLRGGVLQSLHGNPLVELQTSSGLHRANADMNASSMAHRQASATLDASQYDLNRCKERKLVWWIEIRKKCKKAFGKGSRWDKRREAGRCRSAWNSCTTLYYSLCCTQPSGPKTMKAYCDKGDAENALDGKKVSEDKACAVEGLMEGAKTDMTAIVNKVKIMDLAGYSSPGRAPAPAADGPAPAPLPAPAPASEVKTVKTVPIVRNCKELTLLASNAVEKFKRIKTWATEDGFVGKRTGVEKLGKAKDDPIASDPDLAVSVQAFLSLGAKLDDMLGRTKFCTKTVEASDNKDDEDDEKNDDDATEDESDEQSVQRPDRAKVVRVTYNEDAIKELLQLDGEIVEAIDTYETQVHPHGFKWWRYRFEYTIIESVVFAVSVVVLYMLKWCIFGLSFFQAHRFYKTGRASNLHRYTFVYCVLQAACVWVVVAFAYLLYIPWGEKNVLNVCAAVFYSFVDGAFNVPIMGYSWLYLILDIQIQLFATYCLYAMFLFFVTRDYIMALEDWKALRGGLHSKSAANENLYKRFAEVVRLRVYSAPALQESFVQEVRDHRVRLQIDGIDSFEKMTPGAGETSYDFKLHLYLTEGLGKSMEYLVEISLVTNLCLALTALVVAFFAYMYQLAFMYLLPPFLLLGIVILASGYFLSKHYVSLSEDLDHDVETKFITPHNYCRLVQIVLYCIFYSFARLLISADIFVNYPSVYLSALFTLVIIMCLLALFGGQVMKETTCALMLPPHISNNRFKKILKAIMEWHETINCHQCGTAQFSHKESPSVLWAGKRGQVEPPFEDIFSPRTFFTMF